MVSTIFSGHHPRQLVKNYLFQAGIVCYHHQDCLCLSSSFSTTFQDCTGFQIANFTPGTVKISIKYNSNFRAMLGSEFMLCWGSTRHNCDWILCDSHQTFGINLKRTMLSSLPPHSVGLCGLIRIQLRLPSWMKGLEEVFFTNCFKCTEI